jgi:hypothetical protein
VRRAREAPTDGAVGGRQADQGTLMT